MIVAEWDNVAEYGSTADRVSSSFFVYSMLNEYFVACSDQLIPRNCDHKWGRKLRTIHLSMWSCKLAWECNCGLQCWWYLV